MLSRVWSRYPRRYRNERRARNRRGNDRRDIRDDVHRSFRADLDLLPLEKHGRFASASDGRLRFHSESEKISSKIQLGNPVYRAAIC